MEMCHKAVRELVALVGAADEGDWETAEHCASNISLIEHEADNLKRRQEAEEVAARMAGLAIAMVRQAGDTYQLKVSVRDDTPVRDIYIFVNDEKVFYELVDKKSSRAATLDLPVKLKPGLNIITVGAREDDEFAQREILAVFSEKGDPFAD